ncbi:MAG: transcription initiation factor IIA subunit 1 family protein [Candidatus Omnitrophica bacterium]|nr:transcription initiation factor IIA subunit 1 family protein [Candidatus Omnitrophota bacterium]
MKKMFLIIILLMTCISLQGCKGGGSGSGSGITSGGVFLDPMALLNEDGTGDDPLPWTTDEPDEESEDNSGGEDPDPIVLPDLCEDSEHNVVPCIEGPGTEAHSTPEPATFFLLFNSLLGFAFFKRKK